MGVARQHCGPLGKIANCHGGGFLVYASRRGYAFMDEGLHVPEEWFSDESRERWHACMVPFRWATCDESYGKIPAFIPA